MVGIEKILGRIVIGRRSDNHEIGIGIRLSPVKCSPEIQFFLSEILLYVVILNRRNAVIDFLHLLRHHIHSNHFMMLRQQSRHAQADITSTGHRNLQIFKISHIL